MKHPAVLALGAGLLILLVALAMPLLNLGRSNAPSVATGQLPWEARADADGTLAVFGLNLGRDTLATARAKLGDALQPALVARLDEVGALEALMEPFSAGFVTGRLVLSFDVPPNSLQRWRSHAPRSEAMDGGVRRFELTGDDRADADGQKLAGLSFVPGVKLTEADLRQRFGAPAETVAQAGGVKVLLYPAIGMTAAVADSGATRTALQYVAPRDFERRLRAPLAASAAK